jgi:type IV pilus assembly protein PilM
LLRFSRQITGIDIGFESIKIVGVEHTGSRRRVVGFIDIPLSGQIIESDQIKDKNKIAELIKQSLSDAKPKAIHAKHIVTVMPEFLVFSKTLQLPKMDEKDLKTAAFNQAQQYIPVSINDVNLDSQILIAHPDEPLVDILVAATPKALVNEYLEMFKIINLDLLAIETKPIASTRAVISPTDTGGILIMEIGTVNSRISIVDNQQIRFVSTVNIGGDQIIKPLAPSGCTRDEFLKAKYQIGLTKDPDRASSAIAQIAGDLTQAIRYHQNRDYQASRISQIKLCGQGALIPGIGAAIEKEVKIKTVLASFNLPKIPDGLDQRYAVALGLAMYQGDGSD